MYRIGFIIRLKCGGGKRAVRIVHEGKIPVTLIGWHDPKFAKPIFIVTNIRPDKAITFYKQRMKIEECFRDLKKPNGYK